LGGGVKYGLGVIALARTFKRQTVAEGVETQEHLLALREMGCDIAQGYGIARPMPANEVMAWCQNFNVKDLS
jgi:EAL domain-containing protein (putative c-di-GMP-specific phosphodiesterase class I)